MSLPSRSRNEDVRALAALLSSQVRADVINYAITHPDSRFSLTELGRELGLAISSVQHECYKLQEMGLFRVRREGVSRRYQLERHSAVVRALRHLVVSTVGLPACVELALADLSGLSAATLLGDVPPQPGRTSLVLIGDLALETVELAQQRIAWLIDSSPDRLETAFFQPVDWLSKRDSGHPVVRRLLDLPVRAAFGEVRSNAE